MHDDITLMSDLLRNIVLPILWPYHSVMVRHVIKHYQWNQKPEIVLNYDVIKKINPHLQKNMNMSIVKDR